MTLQRECPSGVRPTLPTGQKCPNPCKSEHGKLTEFLSRYASGKFYQNCVSTYIRDNALRMEFEDVAAKLENCGSWLLLREYTKSGKVKLASGNFCDCHMLCVLCAAARSRYLLARYIPAVWNSHTRAVRHFMLTLTWPPGVDRGRLAREYPDAQAAEKVALIQSLAIGDSALRKLWERRRRKASGPFKHVLGIVAATEVTRGASGWHPHFHCVVTLSPGQIIDVNELRREWEKLTGGRQIRLDRLKSASDLVEVFKYAFKPLDVTTDGRVDENGLKWRLLSFSALRGRRLVRSYGCYFRLQADVVPSEECGKENFDLGDYIEWFARWQKSVRSYSAMRISTKAGGTC